MIHKIDEFKPSKLKFGDIVRGAFMQGEYTHDTTEMKPANETHYVPYHKRGVDFDYATPKPYEVTHKNFLMYRLIDGKWTVDPIYCVGTRSLKITINEYDLKQIRK